MMVKSIRELERLLLEGKKDEALKLIKAMRKQTSLISNVIIAAIGLLGLTVCLFLALTGGELASDLALAGAYVLFSSVSIMLNKRIDDVRNLTLLLLELYLTKV